MTAHPYVPIMLGSGWVLERYHGWSVLEQGGSLKLLRKRRGPILTYLLMAHGDSNAQIADVALRHGLLTPLSIVVLNDFASRSEDAERSVAGARFCRVTRERWFGVGTFVVDLRQDLAALFAQMAAPQRTACRRGEALGGRVETSERPSREQIEDFLGRYAWIALERGIERPRRNVLEAMSRRGDLLLARCVDPSGVTLVSNLVYLSGSQGCLLYGARNKDSPGWAGSLAQWEIVKKLKAMGVAWYDLGLVASRERTDGIYRFKESIGGTFIDFGREFQRVPRGLAVAYRAFRGLRGRIRGL